jgi:hypothetical protein
MSAATVERLIASERELTGIPAALGDLGRGIMVPRTFFMEAANPPAPYQLFTIPQASGPQSNLPGWWEWHASSIFNVGTVSGGPSRYFARAWYRIGEGGKIYVIVFECDAFDNGQDPDVW